MAKVENISCSECAQLHCYRHNKKYPKSCLTESTEQALVDSTVETYRGDSIDARVARAAAEVEGLYYCEISRVEEIVAFAKRIDAHRIGVASCLGLIEESKIFIKVLRAAGFEPYTVLCKVGSVDKTDIGIPESLKIQCDCFEACCNPILQAQLLNAEKTDLDDPLSTFYASVLARSCFAEFASVNANVAIRKFEFRQKAAALSKASYRGNPPAP